MNPLKLVLLLLATLLPSCLRLLLWRALGFRVGRGCRVAPFSVIVAERIELGDGAVIAPLVFVYRPTLFSLGERARIGGYARIVGYKGRVVLGPQTFLALGVLIDSTGDFELGARSQIGPRSMLYSHGECGLTFNMSYPRRTGPIRIGADCWLPMGCLVGPDLTIGDGVLLLPGMIVRHDIPAGTALLPPAEEHRRAPARLFQATVSPADRQQILEELLRDWRRRLGGELADDEHSKLWRLTTSRGVIWLLRPGATPEEIQRVAEPRSVLWTLLPFAYDGPLPVFCFETLTISVGWSKLTDSVAAVLCEDYGTHFVHAG